MRFNAIHRQIALKNDKMPIVMKIVPSLSALLIASLLFSCENNAQEAEYLNSSSPNVAFVNTSTMPAEPAQTDPIEMKPVRDTKTGRITSYLPLPVSWKVVTTPQGSQGYQGPGGIQVSGRPMEMYYFNIDPYVAQMTGQQVANPVPVQAIMQQNIIPSIQQQGGTLIKQYELREIAQRSQQMLQRTLNRSQLQAFDVVASEWNQPNGSKSLILVTRMVAHMPGGASTWGVGITELEAPARVFESAKETYLYAQANWQVDRNTAMAHKAKMQQMERESAQRLASSAAAHNARMRSNEAAFQATQRAHTSSSNAILDMGMEGYQNRSASQDRLRNQEVNMIHEEYTMTNPWDNRPMQVQSGYQSYYINSQGQVIGSNDANFNPNVHRDYNQTEWRKLNNGGQ